MFQINIRILETEKLYQVNKHRLYQLTDAELFYKFYSQILKLWKNNNFLKVILTVRHIHFIILIYFSKYFTR